MTNTIETKLQILKAPQIVLAGMFASHTNGLYIVLDMLAQFTVRCCAIMSWERYLMKLQGIYPTLIVILVCLQLTQRDSMDRFEREAIPVSQSAGGTQSRHRGISFAPMSITTSNDSSFETEVQEHTGNRGKDVAVI